MLPAIHVEGPALVDATGKRFNYVGVSDFALFKRWLMPNGPSALVKPRLEEWKRLASDGGYTGPIVLRIFRYAGPWNVFGITDPWSYDFNEVRLFTHFCGDRGFYVDWTCGDSQAVLPNPAGPKGQQQHLNEFVSALVPCSNAFVQTCNEPFKNGIDVGQVVPPVWGSRLRSSGYYTDAGPWNHTLDLDFIDFHPDRSMDGPVPKWVGKAFESAVYLMPFGKPIVYAEPIGADEVNRGGSRSNNPDYFRMLGLSIGLVAGVTFHSQMGVIGDRLGPIQSRCATEFFHGVKCGSGSRVPLIP